MVLAMWESEPCPYHDSRCVRPARAGPGRVPSAPAWASSACLTCPVPVSHQNAQIAGEASQKWAEEFAQVVSCATLAVCAGLPNGCQHLVHRLNLQRLTGHSVLEIRSARCTKATNGAGGARHFGIPASLCLSLSDAKRQDGAS